MPDHTSTDGPEEAVLKHQRIMQRYKALRVSLAVVAIRTRALVQEPGVSQDVVMGFRKGLADLKKAHDVMLNGLCTEMMEELIPIAIEVLAVDKEEGEHCTDHNKTV